MIFYGVLNNAYSKFFNKDLGGSITCKSRHTISLNGLACEAFMGYYRFRNVGAIKHMIKETKAQVYSAEAMSFIHNVKVSRAQLVNHLTFGSKLEDFIEIVSAIVDDLDELTIKKVYYKNHLKAFMNTEYFDNFLDKVGVELNNNYTKNIKLLNTTDENGKPIGLSKIIYSDAYDIPKPALPLFNHLEMIIEEVLFGYYWYDSDYVEEAEYMSDTVEGTFDNMDRTEVCVVDTDSNNILVDDEMLPIFEKLLPNSVIDEEHKVYYNEINAISIVTFVLAKYTGLALTRYKYYAHMPEEEHYHVNMKNEFYFRNLFITTSRKNYIATIMVKEGRVYDKPKMEIKGLALKKSGYNESIRDTAIHIIEDYIFGDKPSLDMYPEIKAFRNDLVTSLKSDKGIDYFTTLKIPNTLDAFDPGEHRVKAINFWNMLNKDQIEPPTNFYVVPMKIDKEVLKSKYPDEFKLLIANLYKHLLRVNLVKPMYRIISGILLGCLTAKKLEVDKDKVKQLKDDVESWNKYYTNAINDAIKTITDAETLEIQLELLKKEINGKRKELEQSIFLYLQSFKSNMKVSTQFNPKTKKNEEFISVEDNKLFTFTDFKNNDVKLFCKIIVMEKYKGFFTNTNETIESLYSKIAMPIGTMEVVSFVKDFVNPEPFIGVFDSIVSPIISEVGLICPRTDDNRRCVTNIEDYF